MSEPIILTPNAPTMLNSLRALGYSFNTAVADIVDNSIAAGADRVDVSLGGGDGESPFLAISDNGRGMDAEELREAMRYACRDCESERDGDDLGRFGLGMKTASLSQCRRLAVISKKNGRTSGAVWDIDRIAETNDWTLDLLDETECARERGSILLEDFESGTLVLWSNFDRLEDRERDVHLALAEKTDELREHLGLVYHRYITGERGLKKVEITIGDVPVPPKDPFAETASGGAERLHEARIAIEGYPNDPVVVTGFTLPHQNRMTGELRDKIGLKGRTLGQDQGFYIYRNGRLIDWGGWYRLARRAQLAKLSRVRIDIPNALDHLWELDIKKSKATPPRVVRERLGEIVGFLQQSSERIIRGRGATITRGSPETAEPWTTSVGAENRTYAVEINREHLFLQMLRAELSTEQKKMLDAYLGILERSYPVGFVNRRYAEDGVDANTTEANLARLKKEVERLKACLDDEDRRMLAARLADSIGRRRPTTGYERVVNELFEKK